MSPKEYFDQHGYVVLSDVLDEAKCGQLTNHIFYRYNQGELKKDDQCPKSDSIYGDPIFDGILADLAEPLGRKIGKTLIPTYTYARIYRPGEVLKKHKDRPSCEISATLTLGYESKFNWPIFFDEEKEYKVELKEGELALYKGTEVCHWRNPFKGVWHVQLFLHYVDADGPYKDHKYDGRSALGQESNADFKYRQMDNTEKEKEKDEHEFSYSSPVQQSVIIPSSDLSFPGFTCINSNNKPELMFTKDECERIINSFQEAYPGPARVGSATSNLRREMRSANVFSVENTPEHAWVWDKISNIVSVANAEHFNYDISGICHSLQLIHYDSQESVPGHYDWHIDAGPGSTTAHRKISLTVQLSDPETYKGCDLEVWDHGGHIVAPKEQGCVNLFPSYMPHKVAPIEQGERYALVVWIHGHSRFK